MDSPSAEAAIWIELAERGAFSPETLTGTRAPLSYATSALWVNLLEESAADQGRNSIDMLGTSSNLSLIMFGVLRHVFTALVSTELSPINCYVLNVV